MKRSCWLGLFYDHICQVLLICIFLNMASMPLSIAKDIPEADDELWKEGLKSFANYEYQEAAKCFQSSPEIISKYYLAKIYFGDFQVDNISQKKPPQPCPEKAIELLKKYLDYEQVKELYDKYVRLLKDKNSLCQFYFDKGNYNEAIKVKRTITRDMKEMRLFVAKCNYYKGIEMGSVKPIKEAKDVLETSHSMQVITPAEVSPTIPGGLTETIPLKASPPSPQSAESETQQELITAEWQAIKEERKALEQEKLRLEDSRKQVKLQSAENEAQRKLIAAEWQAIKEERKALEQEKLRLEDSRKMVVSKDKENKEIKPAEEPKAGAEARTELTEQEKRLLEDIEKLKEESRNLSKERATALAELKRLKVIKETLEQEKKRIEEKERGQLQLEKEQTELEQAIATLTKKPVEDSPSFPYHAVVTAAKAIIWNLPAQPGTIYKPIAELKKGSSITVLEWTTKWYYKIKLKDERMGWVCSALIE